MPKKAPHRREASTTKNATKGGLSKVEPVAELRVSELRRTLAVCLCVDEVKEIRDRATAVAAYYQQRGASLEIQNDAAEVRLRAERRLGELLKVMPKNAGGRPSKTGSKKQQVSPLREIGITRKQSMTWQQIAEIDEEDFEERIATARGNGIELTTTRVLREPRDTQREGAPSPDDTEKVKIAKAMRPLLLLAADWPAGRSFRPLIDALREFLVGLMEDSV